MSRRIYVRTYRYRYRLCLDIASAHVPPPHSLCHAGTKSTENEDDVLQFSSHLFGCSGHNFYTGKE